ncbi:hypothetical protein EVB87_010 [Rhizobium phage RHph_N28_1]|nr:hypothetical protein EVB87_010 [Rhizobium phage RHph_N28_1]QIG74038.1 hypothetical protein EVC07_010 [Rhizobium phage RHph_N42]QXV73697.1 hypothetical protein [Rhizobium phage RHph_N46]
MFLAYAHKIDPNKPNVREDVTFTCQPHDPGALVSLMVRYQRLYNELNDTDVQFHLLTISDMSQSIPLSTLSALGPIELSSEGIDKMRSEALRKRGGYNIQLKPHDQTKSMTDAQIGICELQAFGLPPASVDNSDPLYAQMAPVLKGFIYSGKLWREVKDGQQVWMIKGDGDDEFQSIPGPGFYVLRDGIPSLQMERPV